jgi:hypothetical protein
MQNAARSDAVSGVFLSVTCIRLRIFNRLHVRVRAVRSGGSIAVSVTLAPILATVIEIFEYEIQTRIPSKPRGHAEPRALPIDVSALVTIKSFARINLLGRWDLHC